MVICMFDQLVGALDPWAGIALAGFSVASMAFAVALERPRASPRVAEFTLPMACRFWSFPTIALRS